MGAANSVGLRLGSIKIPEITIPLPTLRLPHLVHYKRSPEVILDKAIAGYQQNADIMDFAQIPPQSEDEADTPTEDEPDTPGPQCPPPAQAPPCYPPHRYCPPEGCTDLMEQQGNGGAWQSAEMYELTKKQRQVAELKSQVSELKQLVDQLARQRAQDTVVAPENKPIKPVGFERPDRNLGEYCAPLRTTPAGPPSPSVNEQVSRMQHQIDALIAAQSTQNQPSSPDGVKTSAEPDQQVPQEAKTRGKGSVLARFKNYFHRG